MDQQLKDLRDIQHKRWLNSQGLTGLPSARNSSNSASSDSVNGTSIPSKRIPHAAHRSPALQSNPRWQPDERSPRQSSATSTEKPDVSGDEALARKLQLQYENELMAAAPPKGVGSSEGRQINAGGSNDSRLPGGLPVGGLPVAADAPGYSVDLSGAEPRSKKQRTDQGAFSSRSARASEGGLGPIGLTQPPVVTGGWIFPRPGESVEHFVETVKPSETSWQETGAAWIGIECHERPDQPRRPETSKLLQAWEGMKQTWRAPGKEASGSSRLGQVLNLAITYGVVVGKWMLFVKKEHVDDVWRRLAPSVHRGELGISAKVATSEEVPGVYLICVYTHDCSDKEDVDRVLTRLRGLGFEKSIHYKGDALTELGIYSKNEWGIKPVSFYSAKEGATVSRANY